MKLRLARTFDRDFHEKSRKKWKNKIRPANCKIRGVLTSFVEGAGKNHNPRKGTETFIASSLVIVVIVNGKNHNPRKGTETVTYGRNMMGLLRAGKNHNPRKGTETFMCFSCFINAYLLVRTIIPVRGRKQILHHFRLAVIKAR